MGIPVFKSTKEAQGVKWPKPRRRKLQAKAPDRTLREKREQVQVKEEAWRAHPVTRIVMFSIGVVSVLVLVALFLPRAQVKLSPVTKTQSIVVPVTASPSVDSVFITGSIPAREKRIVVEGLQRVLVTGEGIEPQSKAMGVVIFRNLTQSAVSIPIGTVVTAGEIRFVTTELGVVSPSVGETMELAIEAVVGVFGDVGPPISAAVQSSLDSCDVVCVRGDPAAFVPLAAGKRVLDASRATLAALQGTSVSDPR